MCSVSLPNDKHSAVPNELQLFLVGVMEDNNLAGQGQS